MKCEALNQSGINLVQVEQDKQPIIIAVRNNDGTYSFSTSTPPGRKINVIWKKTNPKCTCSAKSMKNFECPKIGTIKEGGLKREHGSVWRVTPVCFTIQKL